jgi:hypothetical protein
MPVTKEEAIMADNVGSLIRATIKAVQKASYAVPWPANPMLQEEIMWYATDDSRLLGVVVRDRQDNDFGWVILAQGPGVIYRGIDVATSRATVGIATAQLHAQMHRLWCEAMVTAPAPLPSTEAH